MSETAAPPRASRSRRLRSIADLEPSTLIVSLLATLALVSTSGVGDHYFGALMVDRVSRTTWLLGIASVAICVWRPFGRRTPDGRASFPVLLPAGVSLIVGATWAVRLWADHAAPPWIARFVISSMAKLDETIFGPGLGALLVLLAFAIALGSPLAPAARQIVTAPSRLAWITTSIGGSALIIAGLLLPAAEFANGNRGSRTLLEVPGSGPLLAAAVSAVFLTSLTLRSLDRFEESHVTGWQLGVAIAGLTSHPAAFVLDGPAVVPVAPWFTVSGFMLVAVGAWRFRRAQRQADDLGARSGLDHRPGPVWSVVAASLAVAFTTAPWRRQVVPSSGAGDVVSVDRGVDLLPSWLPPVLAVVLAASCALVAARLTPTGRASRVVDLAVIGGAAAAAVVGMRSAAALLDGAEVGRFGGDRPMVATLVVTTILSAAAIASAIMTLAPFAPTSGAPRRVVVLGLSGAASAVLLAIGGVALIPAPSEPDDVVVLTTDWDDPLPATIELGRDHGTVTDRWQLLAHDEVPLITDDNGAFYEIIGGRPHLASPFDAGFAAELLVLDDFIVVDGQNLEMVPLGAGQQPVVLSPPLELARLTVIDGSWWLEVTEDVRQIFEPLVPLSERVVPVTDGSLSEADFEVPLDVAVGNAGGVRLTPAGASRIDVLAESDPACRIVADGRISFGAVADAGATVEDVLFVEVTDGDGERRVIRSRSDGALDELLLPDAITIDAAGESAPLGAAIIDGRAHLAVGGTLLVVDDFDEFAADLPAEQSDGCVLRAPLPSLETTPIVATSQAAYVPHDGAFDPSRFAYFTGSGAELQLIELVGGDRNDLGRVPASQRLVEFGPFDLGDDLVMVVADESTESTTELRIAMARVGDDPDQAPTGPAMPGGRVAGVVPLTGRAVVAVGATLHELAIDVTAQPLVGFDADIATITGDELGVIHVLLENGEIHRVSGLDGPDGDPSTSLVVGAADGEPADKPIDIQLQLTDDPLALRFELSDESLDNSVDLATDGDDLLVLTGDTLMRVRDGRAVAIGSSADLERGTLHTGTDGPLWASPGSISALDLPT